MTHDADDHGPVAGPAPVNSFAGVLSFLRAVQCRKRIVVLSVIVAGLLGALYYVTATPYYESSAQLLIVATNADALEGTAATNQVFQNILPTYVEVLNSDAVLEEAAGALPPEHRIDFKGVPQNKRGSALRKQLSVSPSRKGNIITVDFRSRDPHTSAVVVESVLDAYLKFMNETHQSNSKGYLDVLTNERNKLLAELERKQQELLRLQQESQVLIGAGDTSMNVLAERVASLNLALSEAQKQTVEAQALHSALDRAIRNGEDLQPFALQEMQSLTQMLMLQELNLGGPDGQLVMRAQEELRSAESELSSKLRIYGENHSRIKELRQKIQQTQQWLVNRRQIVGQNVRHLRNSELAPRLLQMARQKYQQAVARESILRQQVESEGAKALATNSQMSQLQRVEGEVQRLHANLDQVLARMTTIDLGQSGGLKTRIVSSPQVPNKPVSPRLTTVALACLSVGIGIGLALIYIIDVMDDRFRSPDEMRIQLGVPVLAMVRAMQPTGESGIRAVQTFTNPNGLESEAFRTLRTTLSLSEEGTQRIVASSTEPGDGKTTVMANLCVAFAQSGKRTLLIDADMRRPGMTTLLDMKGMQGLSTILRDERPIADCVAENLKPSGAHNLDVIPSGPRPMNPAELLSSDRFSELLAWAETMYDQVVVDAPPVLAVTDPAIVGRLADGVLLVVRPDKNRRKMVIRAAESFHSVGIPVLGIVANHLTPESGGDYYGYGYGYGYEYGYGHDDHDDHDSDYGSSGHPGSDPVRHRIGETVGHNYAA